MGPDEDCPFLYRCSDNITHLFSGLKKEIKTLLLLSSYLGFSTGFINLRQQFSNWVARSLEGGMDNQEKIWSETMLNDFI